jgi:hypothetical protein
MFWAGAGCRCSPNGASGQPGEVNARVEPAHGIDPEHAAAESRLPVIGTDGSQFP